MTQKNEQVIAIHGIGGVHITAAQAFKSERDRLLEKSSTQLVAIRSTDDAEFFSKGLKAIKGFTKQIEEAHQEAKAPVLDVGRKLDALKSEMVAKLEPEAQRLAKALGAWNAEQARIAEEQRQAAIERERQILLEQERKENEARAEQERKERQLREKADNARSEAQRLKLQTELAKVQDEAQVAAEVRQIEQRQAIVDNRSALPVVAKPAGIATRKEIRFEVVDAPALYAAHPYLVSLVPNAQLIKGHLKSLKEGDTLPGVRHWVDATAIVR